MPSCASCGNYAARINKYGIDVCSEKCGDDFAITNPHCVDLGSSVCEVGTKIPQVRQEQLNTRAFVANQTNQQQRVCTDCKVWCMTNTTRCAQCMALNPRFVPGPIVPRSSVGVGYGPTDVVIQPGVQFAGRQVYTHHVQPVYAQPVYAQQVYVQPAHVVVRTQGVHFGFY
jgi:hypothetical protein